MKRMRNRKLELLELALALGLGTAILFGMVLHHQQRELADQMVRLHVVGADNTPEAQELKLLVRDEILRTVGGLGAQDAQEAEERLREMIPQLQETAEKTLRSHGCGDSVQVTLEEERFPTREYETFALPAGNYRALRVKLGDAQGKNWWCVLFPPLCLGAASELEESGLSQDQVNLITLEEGYEVRFRCMEWVENLLSFFR